MYSLDKLFKAQNYISYTSIVERCYKRDSQAEGNVL